MEVLLFFTIVKSFIGRSTWRLNTTALCWCLDKKRLQLLRFFLVAFVSSLTKSSLRLALLSKERSVPSNAKGSIGRRVMLRKHSTIRWYQSIAPPNAANSDDQPFLLLLLRGSPRKNWLNMTTTLVGKLIRQHPSSSNLLASSIDAACWATS